MVQAFLTQKKKNRNLNKQTFPSIPNPSSNKHKTLAQIYSNSSLHPHNHSPSSCSIHHHQLFILIVAVIPLCSTPTVTLLHVLSETPPTFNVSSPAVTYYFSQLSWFSRIGSIYPCFDFYLFIQLVELCLIQGSSVQNSVGYFEIFESSLLKLALWEGK